MKLLYPWENNGLRFLMTIESKSLITHSKIQYLSEENTERLKVLAKDFLSELTKVVNHDAPKELA